MFLILAMTFLFAFGDAASATTATDAMPWESGLAKLQASLTGPVAGIISLIAIVGAGAALVFGGNIQGFMRQAVYLVLVIGLVVGASSLLKALYSDASAVIPFIELLL
jgi:type IV secretion system protein VirB2